MFKVLCSDMQGAPNAVETLLKALLNGIVGPRSKTQKFAYPIRLPITITAKNSDLIEFLKVYAFV